MRIIAVCVFTLLCFSSLSSQVRDVRENVKRDKKSSSSSSEKSKTTTTGWSAPSYDDDGGCAEFIAASLFYVTGYIVYKGFHSAQHAVLNKREKYPELVSLQGDWLSAFSTAGNVWMALPKVRGNYGIFATDLRYLYMHDATGKMHSVDWQLLMIRIPLGNFKLEHGVGFSHFISPSKTYFERSIGFDWSLINRKVNLQGQYRWSQDTSVGRYRQEASIDIDFEVARTENLRFYPFIGFTHFNYFDSSYFDFIKLGLKMRLY